MSWTFDFAGRRPPHRDELRTAIAEAAGAMLDPPIANLGVRGIRKAAKMIPAWRSTMDEAALRDACRNAYIMIDAVGGTGGGLFRYMYSRFLDEAAERTGEPALADVAARLHGAGDHWQDVATTFDKAARATDPAEALADLPASLRTIADLEQAAWQDLRTTCRP